MLLGLTLILAGLIGLVLTFVFVSPPNYLTNWLNPNDYHNVMQRKARLLVRADLLVFLSGVLSCVAAMIVHGSRLVRRNPLLCRSCGYNLTGLAKQRCPECGDPFNDFTFALAKGRGDDAEDNGDKKKTLEALRWHGN